MQILATFLQHRSLQDRSLQGIVVAALLVIGSYSHAQSEGLSLDELMGGAVVQDAASASLDLSTIEAGRALVRQRNGYADLQETDRYIRDTCSCAYNNSCFDLGGSLSFNETRNAANKAEASLSQTMQTICRSWPGAGDSSQTLAMMDTRSKIADKIVGAISQVESSSQDIRSQLQQKDNQIRQAIAQQEEDSSPSFNWGQFAAMTIGAAAGGIGSLDAASQVEILTSITMDSMNGGGGIGNFQSTMNSLNADLAQMQQSLPSSGGSQSSGPKEALIKEPFSFSCNGDTHNVSIAASTQECANAQKTYAKVMGCNLIDEMQSAQRQYESACAAEMYQ